MQLLCTPEAQSTAAAFGDVLERLAQAGADSGHPVWPVLQSGGWLEIGQDGDDGLSRRDLIEFAEFWGRAGLAEPFIPTILAHRHFDLDGPDPAGPWTYPTGRPGGAGYLPFGSYPGIAVAGAAADASWAEFSKADGQVDDFAASLPLVAVDRCPEVPAGLLADTAVLHAGTCVGGAVACLRKASDYAAIRRQYGREIVKFQAVRHILADAFVKTQFARTATVVAANSPDDFLGPCLRAVQLSHSAIEDAIQVFGGIGFTWDLGIHHYLRHAIAVRKLLNSM
jgi:acyl-CoA dehydrogenase-like protein